MLRLSKSQAYKVRTQSNHIFASIFTCFKLQYIAFSKQLNSFALKQKIYIKALQASYNELKSY